MPRHVLHAVCVSSVPGVTRGPCVIRGPCVTRGPSVTSCPDVTRGSLVTRSPDVTLEPDVFRCPYPVLGFFNPTRTDMARSVTLDMAACVEPEPIDYDIFLPSDISITYERLDLYRAEIPEPYATRPDGLSCCFIYLSQTGEESFSLSGMVTRHVGAGTG